MHRKILTVIVLILVWLVPAAAARAADETKRLDVGVKEADASLHDSWFGMYSHEQKIGFLHEAVDKVTEDGRTFYRKRAQAQIKLMALGEKGEINIDSSLYFAARPPFALLSGEHISDDGASKKRVSLVARGSGYQATVTVGKHTRTSTLSDLSFTLADVVSPTLWLKRRPARGETITVADFDVGELYLGKTALKLVATKEVVQGGVKMMVSEVEKIEYQARSKDVSLVRFDSDARVVSSLVAGAFDLRRESEADARKTEFSKDMIFENMAKLDRAVGDLPSVTGLTLKGKGEIIGLLPKTALQSVTRDGDSYLVKIGTRHGVKSKAPEEERRTGLEAGATYPINDPRIVELAKKAIGDATTDRQKADRLCKFVHEFIKYEIVYLPKVEDILERKVGDCKSYALLLTCMARAVGLPAREASGYFYMGDEVKGFGGHAWCELAIDGYWTPVDATLGHTDLVPFYICLGTGREGIDNMTRSLGKLSFQLVEVDRVP